MIEKVIQAIAEPRRREILYLVRGGELTSSAIASHFDISAPAISQHLKVLEESGLVVVRRSGTKRYYSIRREGFAEIKQYIDRF
ncbi:metalloregulator ArsR/SmtB family transcription factor [Neobacillus pocheonensis]|uniref:Metalloregulator ArsR/SmtB family transcription factor n=1 Tax=Neobacillus pocheonensis TaxID=363869 RepID=A0ABT0WCR2_9BACI|nr:metalloregulator ArsR/SmtB family transcription factor [Neobacillus pocheonensis]